MCHHLEPPRTDCIDDFGALFEVSDFELLLEEDARLLVGRLDDTLHEDVVWRRGGRMEQREEVDRLQKEMKVSTIGGRRVGSKWSEPYAYTNVDRSEK
jgi:hypothetical protein